MCMRGKINPEFDNLTADEIVDLVNKSCLSKEDRIIAIKKLKWKMADADIAAYIEKGDGDIVHRTTIGRRLRKTIIPELLRILHLSK